MRITHTIVGVAEGRDDKYFGVTVRGGRIDPPGDVADKINVAGQGYKRQRGNTDPKFKRTKRMGHGATPKV
jgi:hypothetical protein